MTIKRLQSSATSKRNQSKNQKNSKNLMTSNLPSKISEYSLLNEQPGRKDVKDTCTRLIHHNVYFIELIVEIQFTWSGV